MQSFFLYLGLFLGSVNLFLFAAPSIENKQNLAREILLESHRIYHSADGGHISIIQVSDFNQMTSKNLQELFEKEGFEKNISHIFLIHDLATDRKYPLSYKILKLYADFCNEHFFSTVLNATHVLLTRLKKDYEKNWYFARVPFSFESKEFSWHSRWYKELGGKESVKYLDQKEAFQGMFDRAEFCLELLQNDKKELSYQEKDKISANLDFLSKYFLYAQKTDEQKDIAAFGDTESTGIIDVLINSTQKVDRKPIFLGDYGDRWWNDLLDVYAIAKTIETKPSNSYLFVSGNHEREAYEYEGDFPNVAHVQEIYLVKNPLIKNKALKEKFKYVRRLLMVLLPVEGYDKKTNTFFMHGFKDFAFDHASFIKNNNGKSFAAMVPFVKDEKGEVQINSYAAHRLASMPRVIQKAYLLHYGTFFPHPSTWCDLGAYLQFVEGRGAMIDKKEIEKIFTQQYGKDAPACVRAHQHTPLTMKQIINDAQGGKPTELAGEGCKCYTAPAALPFTGNRWEGLFKKEELGDNLLHIALCNQGKEWKPQAVCAKDMSLEEIFFDSFSSAKESVSDAKSDKSQASK